MEVVGHEADNHDIRKIRDHMLLLKDSEGHNLPRTGNLIGRVIYNYSLDYLLYKFSC